MKSERNFRGFFFVLVSFILLSYILVSTYAWVRAIEASERTYSDAFRASTLTTLADQVSEQRMNQYADIASHYALYKLVNHSVEHELRDKEGDEYYHVRAAFFELLSNCTTSPEHYADGVAPAAYTPEESKTYCLSGFFSTLSESLAKSGFTIEDFSVSNYSLNETGHPLELEMNLTLYLKIRDLQTATSLDRTYRISRIVNATGFMDPLLARESTRKLGEGGDQNLTVYKGIYLYPHTEVEGGEGLPFSDAHELFYPNQLGHGTHIGQGWFYGDLVFWDEAESAARPSQSILVGNYSDIKSVRNWEDFGAYILLNEPVDPPGCSDQQDTFNPIRREEVSRGGTTRCEESIEQSGSSYTSKPFIVYADEEEFRKEIYRFSTGPSRPVRFQHSVLFITSYSHEQVLSDIRRKDDNPGAVFDIENLRDFVRCSYYVVNPKAPSFLQRLLEDGYSRSSPIGIETTLVGKWAGGEYNPGWNGYSRVDREFFGHVEGDKIRGMPGCKDVYMCADSDPMVSEVGNFRFSAESAEFYLGTADEDDEEYIGCDDGRASCETP